MPYCADRAKHSKSRSRQDTTLWHCVWQPQAWTSDLALRPETWTFKLSPAAAPPDPVLGALRTAGPARLAA